ncbi:MAG: gamma-glutamylcyclotransferase family protein [Burkholderiaceae bacterium]
MNQGQPVALFTYGSLMFDAVWQRVTGIDKGLASRPRPARLTGYSRHAVAGQTYPALLLKPQAYVDGALYQGIPQDILAVLDEFEGVDYQRVTARAQLTDQSLAEPIVFTSDGSWSQGAFEAGEAGDFLDAEVYLFVAGNGALPQPWSVQRFAQTGMAKFMAQYVCFSRG